MSDRNKLDKRTYCMRVRVCVGCDLDGGDAGELGAVLELLDVLLEDTLGVVVEELPELTVELESDVIKA